jgi:hypothetical protein
MTSPKVWGKHFWYTIHISALGYPEIPNEDDKASYRDFLVNFGNILPCKKCAINYQKHLKELPLDNALRNRDRLFAWTVELHNMVNKAIHKPSWNVEYAEAFYLNGDYDKCKNANVDAKGNIWKYLLICMVVLNLIVLLFTINKVLF